MLSKIKVFISFLVFGGLFLTGCVDEPEMEVVQRPFAQVRVANFITGTDVMNISVDNTLDGIENYTPLNSYSDISGNAVKNNLAKGEFTEYFDLQAGNRPFRITNASGDVIFEKFVELGSWEEVIVLFAGAYSSNEDDNTIQYVPVWIGRTYLDDYHQLPDPNGFDKVYLESNEGVLKMVNASASVVTGGVADDGVTYDEIVVTNNATAEVTTFTPTDGISAGIEANYVGAAFVEGNYLVEYHATSDTSQNSWVSGNFDISAGKVTLLILQGEPSNASFVKYEENIITTTRPR